MKKSKPMTISRDEASVLITILESVGGCPNRSKRAVADTLSARVERIFGQHLKRHNLDGDIYFPDERLDKSDRVR